VEYKLKIYLKFKIESCFIHSLLIVAILKINNKITLSTNNLRKVGNQIDVRVKKRGFTANLASARCCVRVAHRRTKTFTFYKAISKTLSRELICVHTRVTRNPHTSKSRIGRRPRKIQIIKSDGIYSICTCIHSYNYLFGPHVFPSYRLIREVVLVPFIPPRAFSLILLSSGIKRFCVVTHIRFADCSKARNSARSGH